MIREKRALGGRNKSIITPVGQLGVQNYLYFGEVNFAEVHINIAFASYRDRLKRRYAVAIHLFLLLLDFYAWPCLGPALQDFHTFKPISL